ncbi:MAG: hypothetical protein R3C15_00005 [Thermoleophilia bacterium]
MAETVDALGEKADVKGRAKGWARGKRDAVVGKGDALVHGVADRMSGMTGTARERLPDGGAIREAPGRAKGLAESNPVGLAIAGAAVGFLVGMLVPATRVEDERLGPVADDVKGRAREAGREALDRGKGVVQQTTQSALETAREESKAQASELGSSLQERTREAASTSTSSGDEPGRGGA